MANIKELKKKIRSTKGTLKITTAMKLVSAAKLNKAQQAITGSRPYADELEDSIKTAAALAESYNHKYMNDSENNKAVLLVCSANKGLCGGFNSQLAKKVRNYLKETDKEFKVYFIGKKVRELIVNEVNAGKTFEFEKVDPAFREVKEIGEELAHMFTTGEVGSVYVAYNIFRSAISFEPTVKKVLPMTVEAATKEELRERFPFDFKYEPSAEKILDDLIPEAYTTSIYTCLLDSIAAEHGSRMSAMDSASSNCKDAIRSLTLKMNKLRQAAITTELIEVVSGAESLNNG